MLNGDRVRQARELSGLTQSQLAEALRTDQPAIARIESGFLQPDESRIVALANETGFPRSFFFQPDGPLLPLGSLRYRAHASLLSKERTRAYRLAQLVFEIVARLLPRVKFASVRLPTINAPP